MSYSFLQTTDEKGRPSSVVRTGFLIVVISGEAAGWSLWEEIKFNDFRRESGHVVFFQGEHTSTKRYTFYDAALIHLQFRHDGKGTTNRQAATEVELHFSAATIEVHGIRLENFSLIPWATSPATSFKALTKPADPLPSAHLAAGAALLAQAATAVVPKIIEQAKPIPLAGLARTLTLLPSLLLRPMNADADLSKDYDWQLYNRNHPAPIPPPPQPDALRLAELERALDAQTLNAQQEAELIILLARIKGIFVNQLADLTPAQKAIMGPPGPPYSGRRPKNPAQAVLDPDGNLTPYGKWYYERPYKFRQGVRDKTWKEAAKKDPQGRVFDPLNTTEMDAKEAWDMGHKPGYEFRKHQKSAAARGIPREQFLKEHNEHTHYQPELPASNRGHAGEMTTDDYFGH